MKLYRRLPLILAATLMILSCGNSATVTDNDSSLLSPCPPPENSQLIGVMQDSLCGKLSVYENRETQEGRQIELNIMVLPATTKPVKPDPIFLLAGGPGQAAVDVGPFLFARLENLRTERDIVLVDQRGTGESNSLACGDSSTFEGIDLTVDEASQLQLQMMRDCLGGYDADPRLYTTPIAMDDLNEVRDVLGYDQINLMGISYGTRAGLVYLRRHEQTVRSAVLDAVVPLSMRISGNVAVDAESSFRMLAEDCAKQPDCNRTYPNLLEEFRGLLAQLADNPLRTQLKHPRTGELIDVVVDDLVVSRLTRSILYSRDLSRLLPHAIQEARLGNLQPYLTTVYAMLGDDVQMSNGMMASVLCAEDMARISGPNDAALFDNALYYAIQPICEFWPTGLIDSSYYSAVTSDVPVLLTSGRFDPITPPQYGFTAQETLSNSEHIVVSGVGHGTLTTGCMPEVVENFLNEPELRPVEASCTANIKRPLFFTGTHGPTKGSGP